MKVNFFSLHALSMELAADLMMSLNLETLYGMFWENQLLISFRLAEFRGILI